MPETIQSIIEKFNAVKEAMKENAPQLLGDFLKEQFAKVPEVLALRWTQYTPYFNDGDPCTFGVNNEDPEYHLAPDAASEGDEASDEDEEDDREFVDSYEIHDAQLKKRLDQLEAALVEIPEEFYFHAFGDHVQVTVNRVGDGVEISVDEYEHD